jgi:hypothetical protein
MPSTKCKCKKGPPEPRELLDEDGEYVPIHHCDFCDESAPAVERVGDKVACAACTKPDEEGWLCDCCGHPMRILDDGGTNTGPGNATVCERCWAACPPIPSPKKKVAKKKARAKPKNTCGNCTYPEPHQITPAPCIAHALLMVHAEEEGMTEKDMHRRLERLDVVALWEELGGVIDDLMDGVFDSADFCISCEDGRTDDGEGWNGECGNCADRTSRKGQ